MIAINVQQVAARFRPAVLSDECISGSSLESSDRQDHPPTAVYELFITLLYVSNCRIFHRKSARPATGLRLGLSRP